MAFEPWSFWWWVAVIVSGGFALAIALRWGWPKLRDRSLKENFRHICGTMMFFDSKGNPKGGLFEHDVWLQDAIWRAHLGKWEKPDWNEKTKPLPDETISALNDIADKTVRQLAREDRLPIWGKRSEGDNWERLEPEFWKNHELDWFSFMLDHPEDTKTRLGSVLIKGFP